MWLRDIVEKFERKLHGPVALVALALASVAAFVLVVEVNSFGVGAAFSFLFESVPLLLSLGLAYAFRATGPWLRFASYGFATGAAGLVLFLHIVWAFDIGRIRTSSSTIGLVFVFVPFYAMLVGAIVAVPTGAVASLVFRVARARGAPSRADGHVVAMPTKTRETGK